MNIVSYIYACQAVSYIVSLIIDIIMNFTYLNYQMFIIFLILPCKYNDSL